MIRVYLFVANRLTTVGNKDVKFGFKRIRSGTQVSRIINRTPFEVWSQHGKQ